MSNIRLVNGSTKHETRQRLMRTFNSPFFPEVPTARPRKKDRAPQTDPDSVSAEGEGCDQKPMPMIAIGIHALS
jgi:hypothetical protein